MMIQICAKADIKKLGQKWNNTIMKELQQLHDRRARMPKMRVDLTCVDRQKVLRYIMFIKEKCDGNMKVRECADGRPQGEYTQKEDARSPTMSLKAMMISC